MKIAIPVDDRSMETTVCQSFGRAPYFLIYDLGTNDPVFLDNNAAASQGGAGIKAAQTIVDSGASALLVPRCGQNASDVIKAAGIEVYKTKSESIKDTIEAFRENKLELLLNIHPGFHKHGNS